MQIKTAHKILIASAIAFFISFGVWQFRSYVSTGEARPLVGAILSVLVAIGFGIYFRTLRWKKF